MLHKVSSLLLPSLNGVRSIQLAPPSNVWEGRYPRPMALSGDLGCPDNGNGRVCQLIGEVGGKVRVTPDTQTRKLVISFGTNKTLAVTDLYTLPCHHVDFQL